LTSISNINEYLFLINNNYYLKIKDVESFISIGFFTKEDMYKYKPYTKERFTIMIKKSERVFLYSELNRFYTKKELRIRKIDELLTI